MSKKGQEDPFRADAAKVFRSLRDAGPAPVATLAERCWPVDPDAGPASTVAALRKRSVRKVLDSLVWMRHQGVVLSCVPDPGGSVFHLGLAPGFVSPLRSFQLARPASPVVTAKVSQPALSGSSDHDGDEMSVWHGR